MVGLADRHDPSRLEAACAKAITAGDPSYRTVKGILAVVGAGAFLHGPASFANVVPMPGAITTDELAMPAANSREEARP